MHKKFLIVLAGIISCSVITGTLIARSPKKAKKARISTRNKKTKECDVESSATTTVTEKVLESSTSTTTIPAESKKMVEVASPAKIPVASTSDKKDIKKSSDAELSVPKAETNKTIERLPAAATTTVTVKNAITKKMITYTYMFIGYTPNPFTLTVNGKEIKMGEQADIVAPDGRLEVVHYANFRNGYRETSKKFIFKLKAGAKSVSLTFNWHKDQCVLIDNATVESITTLME